jgi:ubiquinone/menaquinone biosynthesis C-methylase UbiE
LAKSMSFLYRRDAKLQRNIFLLLTLSLLAVLLVSGAAPASDEIPRLAKILGWKDGAVIADVGAGEGQYAFAAHDYVGSSGRVYATELDQEKLAALKTEAARRGWKNFEVLEAAEKDTNLPVSCCDAILLRRVYHHLTAPAEMDASLYKSLKPSGVLVVIDFPPRADLTISEPVKGVPANRGGHGIPQKVLIDELTTAGFAVDKIYNDWPADDYCVLFRKAPAASH